MPEHGSTGLARSLSPSLRQALEKIGNEGYGTICAHRGILVLAKAWCELAGMRYTNY
jgi:hypothetical protein